MLQWGGTGKRKKRRAEADGGKKLEVEEKKKGGKQQRHVKLEVDMRRKKKKKKKKPPKQLPINLMGLTEICNFNLESPETATVSFKRIAIHAEDSHKSRRPVNRGRIKFNKRTPKINEERDGVSNTWLRLASSLCPVI
ncbi:hypothetical protein PoB_003291800 [Plakobranchus ocellatus]|uniref:Uncharacterized protein n=1 Tax=Plakobranchus ocellatus TaxID=259542 RepID=A0AAV4AGK6_9GAST|nr:hypothetical protein PoB_003291800 [Plakobranchus ocellatus]